MLRAGIVGGLGPESTVDYYRRILEEWQRAGGENTPPMIIDSLDANTALRLAGSDRPAFTAYILDSVLRLGRAAADFVVITANTPHLMFDELAAQSPVPMISIVEVCADEAQRLELKRLGLLGTRFTMEASFYPDVFSRRDMEIVVPDDSDRTWVHSRYVDQLLKGDFREETRSAFTELVEKLHRDRQIDGVILGGTELPLLLGSAKIAGMPVLDTTQLHVSSIVRYMLEYPSA
jgi:aspartate racemase